MNPKKTFCVLGSNCFSASHLVNALLGLHSDALVAGISRSPQKKPPLAKNFRFHQIHMTKQFGELITLLDDLKPSHVINYAALSEVFLSNEHPQAYFDINTLAVVKLCDELKKRKYLKHYIHISSAEVYGPCEKPVDEKAPLKPTSAYAASKAAADFYLQTALERHHFPVSIVRSTNVYGKYQQLFKIIPRTILYLKLKRPIELHGGGKVIRSFIHIQDVSKGVLQIIEKEKVGQTYHFATEDRKSIAAIARLICEKMGCDFEKVATLSDERPNQDRAYLLDYSKARAELNWRPEVDFEKGLDEVLSWIETNWTEIQNQPLEYIHKV